ncbi:MAG: RecX family transcriptional regulator [Candidatus Marinimicrobia bacterium]|nr:RecX family transcriptional regulator [Candidatus Neomarinimicrobiota bacterium]
MSRITAITQQKKLQHRFNLFVDGKFEIGVDGSLVIKYDLKTGDPYTAELQHNLENDDRVELAYTGLLNFIAYRERCEFEVMQWLFKKGYSDLEDDLVKRLKDKNYLNDSRFARLFIRDRVKLKGWGPNRLRNELFSKRIGKNIIEDELEIIRQDYDFDQMAAEQIQRKVKYLTHPTFKDKKRLWTFLQRRGFESSSITLALSQIEFTDDI